MLYLTKFNEHCISKSTSLKLTISASVLLFQVPEGPVTRAVLILLLAYGLPHLFHGVFHITLLSAPAAGTYAYCNYIDLIYYSDNYTIALQ